LRLNEIELLMACAKKKFIIERCPNEANNCLNNYPRIIDRALSVFVDFNLAMIVDSIAVMPLLICDLCLFEMEFSKTMGAILRRSIRTYKIMEWSWTRSFNS
jgi:hypothetical protein